ncbi:MAG: TRAP transporter large permease [Sphaerochaetaceae bacterium]|nr:TRAP transporter large permease [Sphaerochaetaceae bacterium]
MSVPLLLVFVVLIVSFVVKVPVALSMMVSGIFYLLITGQDIGLAAELILSRLYASYLLMAVPLFVFTASILNSGAITEKIFNFARVLFGRWKGGLGHVNVFASLIFSGMTGSAIADASGLGLMEIDAMRKEGYDDGFSCAVTACSATIGPIFPPSIPLVIYSMLSGASVGALFWAGMVPGVMIAIALMIYIMFIANIRNYPRGEKYKFKEFISFTAKAFPALLTPVILLTGIYTGVMTPTEAGAVAAFYALLISILIYRTVGFKSLWSVVLDTVKTTGTIGLTVGAAMFFSYIITNENVSESVGAFLIGFGGNRIIFLLVVNIVLLLLGMFFDTSTIQLILIPILAPIAEQLGIDLIHFGIIFTLNTMIGLSTPPFGILLFILSGISGEKLKVIIKETIPMLGVMLIVLGLVTYIPDIVLFAPRMFGY